jgi:hypothetical protein
VWNENSATHLYARAHYRAMERALWQTTRSLVGKADKADSRVRAAKVRANPTKAQRAGRAAKAVKAVKAVAAVNH